jgi:hypothetical protein
MGWTAYSNGQLLDEAERAGFEAIVTGDQNFVTQQNLTGRRIAVVVLFTNTWPLIRSQPETVRPMPRRERSPPLRSPARRDSGGRQIRPADRLHQIL